MHCLTICFGPAATIWTFLFQTEAKARDAHTLIIDHPTAAFHGIIDDFGQIGTISGASICGIMLEDLDRSKLAHVEKGLHNARTQADYSKRVMADPSARPPGVQGPGILQPMGNGGFRQ
jgi:hypothetical protein